MHTAADRLIVEATAVEKYTWICTCARTHPGQGHRQLNRKPATGPLPLAGWLGCYSSFDLSLSCFLYQVRIQFRRSDFPKEMP